MAKKVDLNKTGIEKLPNDKPVVYKISTDSGKTNYIGVAQRGRVQDRIREHLPGNKDYIPGNNVQIEQFSSIKEAKEKEERLISKHKPKYNDKGT